MLTALEIVDAVKAVAAVRPLRVRIGIATGAVVVGETGGGDASLPKTAIGATPNVAARVLLPRNHLDAVCRRLRAQ